MYKEIAEKVIGTISLVNWGDKSKPVTKFSIKESINEDTITLQIAYKNEDTNYNEVVIPGFWVSTPIENINKIDDTYQFLVEMLIKYAITKLIDGKNNS